MIIRVSDLGITRLNSGSGEASKVGYVSYNERTNNNPVKKVNPVQTSTSRERSVAKETGRDFVSASTPAYSVGFTSQGMSALKSFKAARSANEAVNKVRENVNKKDISGSYNNKFSDSAKKAKSVGNNSDDKNSRNYVSTKQTRAIKAYSYQMEFGNSNSRVFEKDRTR